MGPLSKSQEQSLETVVQILFACAKEVADAREPYADAQAFRPAREDIKYLLAWETPASPLSSLELAAYVFLEELGRGDGDCHGALALGHNRVLEALRSFLLAPGETGTLLAEVLSFEDARDMRALRNLIDAGIALDELRSLDPNLFIVSPGVVALRRAGEDGRLLDSRVYTGDAIDVLKNTVVRTFSP
jgi:hypothetical protein